MTSWRSYLTVRGVLLPPPEVRRCPNPTELKRCESRLRTTLPNSYRGFCAEIGAGSLGDVDFIGPGTLPGRGFRKRDRLAEHVRLARRAMADLDIGLELGRVVSFASTSEGDWFFWLLGEMSQPDPRIFLASPDLESAVACAENLEVFIDDVCLGSRLVDLGLYENQPPAILREFMPVR
ncbi:MAG: SMI1/KNR4 family protein [Deltaproteobacteria bacterium]|nr:SMI1/KNR4 family protein [Deltaproteobacteria bacterium]